MKPKQISHNELPEQQTPSKEIVVYVCPREECPNFYAAPGFRTDRTDLFSPSRRRTDDGDVVNGPMRIMCPTCRIRGIDSERVPYVVTAVVPLEAVMKAEAKRAKDEAEKERQAVAS